MRFLSAAVRFFGPKLAGSLSIRLESTEYVAVLVEEAARIDGHTDRWFISNAR